MTNSALPIMPGESGNSGGIQAPTPPMYYWTARGMAKRPSPTIKRIHTGVDHAIDDFQKELDFYQQALGLHRNPDPVKRLMSYYNKPDTWDEAMMMYEQGLLKVPRSWESQKAYFPADWDEDWTDFQNLRLRARNGDFGLEVMAQEAAYSMGDGDGASMDLLNQQINPALLPPGPAPAPGPTPGGETIPGPPQFLPPAKGGA